MKTTPRERASAVCVHDARLLCVLLRDPATRVARAFVPGGAIEPGESPERTAERETLEETGYRVIADPASRITARYPFEWNGTRFDVTTHFVRARLAQPGRAPREVADAAYNEGALWIPLPEVRAALGFHALIMEMVLRLVPAG